MRDGVFTAWLLLGACADPPPDDAPGGSTDVAEDTGAVDASDAPDAPDWFAAWEEGRRRVRQSPDHLEARAEALVAAGDALGLFALVRDHVQTMPPAGRVGFHPMEVERLYGARGALRAGAGSPRDKADLLAALLVDAGVEAVVRRGDLEPEHRLVSSVFAPAAAAPFTLGEGVEALVDAWRHDLGASAPAGGLPVSDPAGTAAGTLSDVVAAHVPVPTDLEDAARWLDEPVPFVRAVLDGTEVDLNPSLAGAEPGAPGVSGDASALAASPAPAVAVRFWARRVGAGGDAEEITLAEGSWDSETLIGRQLHATLRPPLPLEPLLPLPLDGITTFVPELALEGRDLDPEVAAALTVRGDAVTLAGVRLRVDEAGTVWADGEPWIPEDAAAVEPVASASLVDLRACPGPQACAWISARDALDRPVRGLTAADVVLTEEGEVQAASVAPLPAARRVAFLYDGSTSLPLDFRDAGRRALFEDLATALSAEEPTTFRVGSFTDPVGEGWFEDVDTLGDAVDAVDGPSSELWPAVGRAIDETAPEVLVVLSDFETFAPRTRAVTEALARSGTRVVGLGVGVDTDEEVAALEELEAVSGGVAEIVADAEAAIAVVLSAVPTPRATHRITWRSPAGAPGERAVDLEVAGLPLSGVLDLPLTDGAPSAMVGLHLTVELGSTRVTRTLAGLPAERDLAEATEADADAVHAAAFGRTVVAFDAAGTPLAHLADDLLHARLGLRPVHDARGGGAQEAWEAGVRTLPGEALRAFLPLDPGLHPVATRSRGLRAVLWSEAPGLGADGVGRVDFLPLGHHATALEDAAEGWRTTLRRTATLALLEAEGRDTSTAALLEGAPLEALTPAALRTRFAEHPRADDWARLADRFTGSRYGGSAADHRLLVPTSGTPVAAWDVWLPTGEVVGLLEDGSGGARSDREGLARRLRIVETATKVLNLAGYETGFWVELEIAKAKVVAYSTLALLDLEGWRPEDGDGWSPESAVGSLVCGQLVASGIGALPRGVGTAYDALWFLLHGRDPVCDEGS